MDTINTLTSAATKAIWGESGNDGTAKASSNQEEPISGVQGDTSKGEPFDAGNAEGNADTVTDQPRHTDASEANPSSRTPEDNTAAQVDTREPGNEQTAPSEAESKSNVDNVEPLDPKSLKGPGPKPLEQIAKEHGGDAGTASHDAQSDESHGEPPNTGGHNTTAQEDASPKDAGSERADEADTGDKAVKSSGLAADGGDFDAANPGAGREADRLLEEKGIRHETKPTDKSGSADTNKSDTPTGESSSPERKGVKGLGHKIKSKLQRSSNA